MTKTLSLLLFCAALLPGQQVKLVSPMFTFEPTQIPKIWKLAKSKTASPCVLRIGDESGACFVPVGRKYSGRQESISYLIILPAYEEISIEQAEGMLYALRIQSAYLDAIVQENWIEQ